MFVASKIKDLPRGWPGDQVTGPSAAFARVEAEMGRRLTLAQQATGRELATLVDGLWVPRWYWRDDLQAMQTASRRR